MTTRARSAATGVHARPEGVRSSVFPACTLGLVVVMEIAASCGTGDGSSACDSGCDWGEEDDGAAGLTEDGSSACDPGCHWDCFGGITCEAGDIWLLGYGARPCCSYAEPWPGPGPTCGLYRIGTCEGGTCSMDPRYSQCRYVGGSMWLETFEHLTPLFCPENWPRVAGDHCETHADCRPVAEGTVPRLRCDADSSTCVAEPRPEAPAGFGESCGLAPEDHSWLQRDGVETLVSGVMCDVCHAVWNEADGCWRQACTLSCQFDEDCPEGTLCLCPDLLHEIHGQFCAAATDRDSSAGRSAGLACP